MIDTSILLLLAATVVAGMVAGMFLGAVIVHRQRDREQVARRLNR
jgi:hypothetical protein